MEIDNNVKFVVGKYLARAKMGRNKYGTDTERMDLDTWEWLNHLQEELMDATIYIQRLKADIQDPSRLDPQMELSFDEFE
jgi:hypothetical protein